MERLGKGIGSVPRYRIVEALLRGPKTVSELVKIVKLSQPAISQHLKTLKASELVTDERCGQEVIYSINSSHLLRLLKILLTQVEKQKKNHLK